MGISATTLFKKQLEKSGLTAEQLTLGDGTLDHLIEAYAREAGVRNLEKYIGMIARKVALKLLEGATPPIVVTPDNLSDYLGKPLFENEKAIKGVGVITGLAWTPLGGATLSVEANCVHRYGRGFKLTGQLGDVMKESAEIAYGYILSQGASLNVAADFFEKAFVHLHVPAGATPKDGPSAGITMASALLSLAKEQPVEKNLAMTGELTLTGQVLPVGGIQEKVIAARRLKIDYLILPEANRRDFDDLPAYIKEGLQVQFVSTYHQVAALLWQ